MKAKFLVFLLFFVPTFVFAKETHKIGLGQYLFVNKTLERVSAPVMRFVQNPLAPRVQPLAHIGLAQCIITSITTNAAGKWEVCWLVVEENNKYEVRFQLAVGDVWQLFLVDPQRSIGPSIPIELKVVSIKNNEIEVSF